MMPEIFASFLARPWTQRVFRGVEQHIAHIHDQAASRATSLENHVELDSDLLPQRQLLLLGLLAEAIGFVGGLARFIGFRLR
jgi:hypothetical protein